MKYRKLRIAWSVAWGVVAVLLCVLWVVSYVRMDQVLGPISSTEYVACTSALGELRFGWSNDPVLGRLFGQKSAHRGFPLTAVAGTRGGPFFPASVPLTGELKVLTWPRLNKNWAFRPAGITHDELIVPYWTVLLGILAMMSVPWLRWRFSLRTLLIATTLVGIGLGTIIALSR